MDIRQCIADLLSLHDCVIIPGFGGFIGNYSPARIDSVHHTFHPPAKKILFNINLRQNDGLLANAVAESFGCSYYDACRLLDEFCEEIWVVLKSEKPFVFQEIGSLSLGSEGTVHFEQETTANLLADAFGLTSFISPPVIRTTHGFKKALNPISRTFQSNKKGMMLPRALKWAAVIALPIGVATLIGVTQYSKISSGLSHTAGMMNSLFSKTEAPATKIAEKPKLQVTSPKPPSETTVAVKPDVVTEPVVAQNRKINTDEPIAIIVGAFQQEENAQKLIAELEQKGVESTVYDQSKTGLFRVTIGTCNETGKAAEILEIARALDFNDAWVLIK